MCKQCCLARHQLDPLHRLQVMCYTNMVLKADEAKHWNDTFFEQTTFHLLGLRVQLGHHPEEICHSTQSAFKEFTVIHVNGIQVLAVDFCGCDGSPPHYQQLLDIGWWPATPLQPQSAATFQVLAHFQAVNLHGTCPATDYYRALQTITDGSGLHALPVE